MINTIKHLLNMNHEEYVDTFLSGINEMRKEEFKRVQFHYEEQMVPVKLLNEADKDYNGFKRKLQKDARYQKSRQGNIHKKVYEPENVDIDILKDDIFQNGNPVENANEEEDMNKLDIENMTRDEKMEMIHQYCIRKNITLDEIEMTKIRGILDNPLTPLKKYITISKIYQQITKISFIKRMENGLYYISTEETKGKKKAYFH